MNMLKAGVQNEMAKLLSLKKYKAFLFFACLLSILTGLSEGTAKGVLGLLSANTPLTILSIATSLILPLVIAMAAADLFTAEQENGSIKAAIARPVSRINIFTSKVLAIALYTILLLMVCFAASLVWGIAFNTTGLLDIVEMLIAYAVSTVPIVPVILFAVAVSQLCKSSSSTVMLTIFGYIILLAAGTVFPRIYPMLFTSYTNWYKLFIGVAMPVTSILNVLALLAAYALILFAAGSWTFESKEY